jgi:hypothetical protein
MRRRAGHALRGGSGEPRSLTGRTLRRETVGQEEDVNNHPTAVEGFRLRSSGLRPLHLPWGSRHSHPPQLSVLIGCSVLTNSRPAPS